MCKSESIICLRKANNIHNYFACFWNYTKQEVLKMIMLEILLVLIPVGYLNTILMIDTNNFLKDPLDLDDFMRWVGCWLYMACQVGIPESHDWWSVTPTVIHRVPPFCLKKYMSQHNFDEIIASLRYKNRSSQYKDGLFHMRQTEESQKKNMADEFNPSWINVTYERIMDCYNNTPAGFMCVRQKPHPFGNERCKI